MIKEQTSRITIADFIMGEFRISFGHSPLTGNKQELQQVLVKHWVYSSQNHNTQQNTIIDHFEGTMLANERTP
jgi:hypothetical protein